ncbi:ABC transporter permease [Pseudomonas sp. NA-150]|uniref:ABC transporter permease n=1 Tax=Pseudomonas sp. NA-150 TaxID=3367525 RepID=UPI0037C7C928
MAGAESMSAPTGSQVFVEAIDSLRLLGRRSVLALLGIVIGSASIIALLNVGRNAADEALRTFKDMGTDTLVASFPFSADNKRPLPITLDVQAIRQALPQVSDLAPLTQQSVRVSREGVHADASLVGTTTDLAAIMGLRLHSGRFISPLDQRATFIVVGARVAEDLRVRGRPLHVNDVLQIDHYLFQVIGIAASQSDNTLLPILADESVWVSLDSLRRLRPSAEIGNLVARVVADADLAATAVALEAQLKQRLDGREVSVQIPQQLLEGLQRQADTFTWLLAGLGGISLVVGGVGVMNVMLMNVIERRREIGVRMALGARPRDIRRLFLLEAVALSIVGATLGAVLGVASAYGFAWFSGWQFSLSPLSLPLGIGSSLLMGVFFGLYPAISASRLSPITALRDE